MPGELVFVKPSPGSIPLPSQSGSGLRSGFDMTDNDHLLSGHGNRELGVKITESSGNLGKGIVA